MTKKCSSCLLFKPLEEFHRSADRADGHKSQCKVCRCAARIIRYVTNVDIEREQQAIYYSENRQVIREEQSLYRKENRELCNALGAKYRATKLQRTPGWLTSLQLDHIKLFYEAARSMTKHTGIDFEVDHVLPLQGDDISGLHVPWNLQVITGVENNEKNNKYDCI